MNSSKISNEIYCTAYVNIMHINESFEREFLFKIRECIIKQGVAHSIVCTLHVLLNSIRITDE